jgi:short-subunit dehydrogenase
MKSRGTARHPQTALVTGASSGIGYELARIFARDGYHLVLVARHTHTLGEVAAELQQRYGGSVKVMAADLALPQAPEELFATLEGEGVAVDVLVNNAGFGTHGPFAESEARAQLEMMQVNMVALTHLTRLFLPGMRARRWGRILNVASTAAFQPGPLMAVYYASKAYVLSFSEALANELRGSGVSVTALCPGPTRTNFQSRAGIDDTPLMRGRIMSAQQVAEAGYRGLMAGQVMVIPGLRNRLLAVSVRWLPRRLLTHIVRNIQEKRKRSLSEDPPRLLT